MKRLNLLKYGLTAMMMAFAMTLCYSCSSDDDEETNQEVNPLSNGDGVIDGHAYVELAGYKWATENVAKSDVAKNQDADYGCYFMQYYANEVAESWGSGWTLPSEAQWQKLIDECYWERTENYHGKKGCIVYKAKKEDDKGKYKKVPGYSPDTDVHIFLPAAGISYYEGGRQISAKGSSGYYKSTVENRCLYFIESGYRLVDYCNPLDGLSIRLVAK